MLGPARSAGAFLQLGPTPPHPHTQEAPSVEGVPLLLFLMLQLNCVPADIVTQERESGPADLDPLGGGSHVFPERVIGGTFWFPRRERGAFRRGRWSFPRKLHGSILGGDRQLCPCWGDDLQSSSARSQQAPPTPRPTVFRLTEDLGFPLRGMVVTPLSPSIVAPGMETQTSVPSSIQAPVCHFLPLCFLVAPSLPPSHPLACKAKAGLQP